AIKKEPVTPEASPGREKLEKPSGYFRKTLPESGLLFLSFRALLLVGTLATAYQSLGALMLLVTAAYQFLRALMLLMTAAYQSLGALMFLMTAAYQFFGALMLLISPTTLTALLLVSFSLITLRRLSFLRLGCKCLGA
ncbi:MAG TPA: hypothetical protein VE082_02250, partial [Desulfobaccales bacterium]|nr:hypothetical protein [Desulfobaccales bacterium]